MALVDALTTTLTLRTPFAIAHDAYATRETVAVLFKGRNAIGHGEAPVVPYYGVTAELLATDVLALVNRHEGTLAELSLSERLSDAELTVAALSACAAVEADEGAHLFSRAAVSEAVSDWAARATEVRVSDLLGLRPVFSTRSSFTIAERDLEEARYLTLRAAEAGARLFKVKCGFPGDAELVAAVREAAADAGAQEPALWADCNGGWSAETAVTHAQGLVDQGVTLIEEPVLHDLSALQQIASSVAIPVIADESVRSEADLELLLSQAPDAAGCVLKVAKHGGPLTTARMRLRLQEVRAHYMVGQMVESSVGTAWGLLFADGADWVDLDAPALIVEDPASGAFGQPGFFGLSSEGRRIGIGAQWSHALASE